VSDPAAGRAAPAHPYGSFLAHLTSSLRERRADGQALAVLFVDLGAVARVDLLGGFRFGDAIRERFSLRLRTDVLRARDFVGEIGRDELACVLDGVPSQGVPLLAAQKILRVLEAPVLAGELEVYAAPAVGIALDEGGEADAAMLLTQARAACREARGFAERTAFFAGGEASQDQASYQRESRLRAALAHQSLVTMFQPQVECRSGRIVGVEAVLGWGEGAPGIVTVEEALVVADAAGRASETIERIFNDALRNCGEFRQAAGLDLRLAIRLPVRCLRDPGLADLVGRSLKTWTLRAGRLDVTVTDAPGLLSDAQALQGLHDLAGIGVRICVDMTGIGPSEFVQLAALPVDGMRMPAAVFERVAAGAKTQEVVTAYVELAHRLGMEVLFDGVATQSFADRLVQLGCDYLQGALVGSPLEPTGFVARHGQ